MQTELTPKQQASELIKQAQNILIITGRQPSNDQLSAAIATQRVINKLQKQASIVITDALPEAAKLYDTQFINRDIQGVRDFIISVDMHSVVVDKLKYNVEGERLDVTITPLNGNLDSKDVTFKQGAFRFDLVITLGVPQFDKLDKIVEQDPTIFDGLHLINIDYHRINQDYGSVNYIDANASSVCEMLVSLFESLEQGIVDESIATALYTGITTATHNFTIPATTAKAMTVAAQMLAAGAKMQEIVKVMQASNNQPSTTTQPASKPYNNPSPQASAKPTASISNTPLAAIKAPDESAPTTIKEALEEAQKQIMSQPEQSQQGSKKNLNPGLKDSSKPQS